MSNSAKSFYDWYKQTIRNPKYRWFIVVGSLLYLLSPIDILPDLIPLVGWIDDGIIAALLVAELSQILLGALTGRVTSTAAPDLPDESPTIDVSSRE